MHALQHYVGPKFGGWITGTVRFPTEQLARNEHASYRSAEHAAGATRGQRRVVEVER